MLHFGIGVSHRTANTLLNDGGGSNSKTLFNELFPSLKTRINDILQRALKEGYSLFVLIILKQELDIDRSLFVNFFYTALVAGDSGTIKALSRMSYSRDVRILYATVKGGHVEIAKLLLEKGADVNARNCSDRTALYVVAERGHVDMAKLLLEKGADPNARDCFGRTALQAAATGRHAGTVALLQNQQGIRDHRSIRDHQSIRDDRHMTYFLFKTKHD
jgi:hypothetical protein